MTGRSIGVLVVTSWLTASCLTDVSSQDPTDTNASDAAVDVFCEEPLEVTMDHDPPFLSGQGRWHTYEVIDRFPHDSYAFTQGLLFRDGFLYEGTGQYGLSTLRQVDLETGGSLKVYELARNLFGEGITLLGDRLFQLTWQSQLALEIDVETFEEVATYSYPTQGWGLTDNGQHLIMSDGSDTLYFRDPDTFDEVDRIQVVDSEEGPIRWLNELELIEGQIYANIWQSDWIVRIDPDSGEVLGWIDLSGLLPDDDRDGTEDVLNGIAYDAEGGRLFITGKWWPWLFQVRLIPLDPA